MRRTPTFDMPLFLSILILVGLGVAFIYSASYPKAMANSDGGGFYDGFFFAGRQLIFAVAGLGIMLGCMFISLPWVRRISWWIIGLSIGALVLVLVLGTAKHGNKAWIELGPLGQFQPSEFIKLAVVLTLSAYLAKCPWSVKSLAGIWRGPVWFLLAPLALVGLQGDLGTAFVLALGTIVLFALGGMRFRFWGVPLLGLGLLGALGVVILMQTSLGGHRVERFRAWLNPMDERIAQSHQPRQSLIAVGSGGMLGRGFCGSRQKFFYLPGTQNDYILAVIAEELGFLKLAAFLALYFFVIYRGFNVAHRAPDEYSALVASGCTVMLATQALINMAVVTNSIPCMGVNLPFISYGGSSIIASMMMAGMILNVSGLRPGREGRRNAGDDPAALAASAVR